MDVLQALQNGEKNLKCWANAVQLQLFFVLVQPHLSVISSLMAKVKLEAFRVFSVCCQHVLSSEQEIFVWKHRYFTSSKLS